MENKQLQIHIEKIKLLYQNSLIPIMLRAPLKIEFYSKPEKYSHRNLNLPKTH